MVGKVTSLGDTVMKSNIARTLFNLDGTGVKIGLISNSFNALNGLNADIQSGDLPGQNNPLGRTTPVTIVKDLNKGSKFGNDEGRALAQIAHDIAPGASIFFHTQFANKPKTLLDINQKGFDNAVSALIARGVDIIIDDSVIPAPLFQDGIAARSVEKATNAGIVYISAAGNNGNISYESKFRPGSTFSLKGKIFGTLQGKTFVTHDFDPGPGVDLFQNITATKDGNVIIRPLLGWDKPMGNARENYVMFLLNTPELPNEKNTIMYSFPLSLDVGAVKDPLRQMIVDGAVKKGETLYLAIARESTNTPPQDSTIKWVSYANGSDRTLDYEYIDKSSLNRTVIGQANAPTAITVGASDVNNPQKIRDYSSKGASPILFDPEGNRLASPILRDKPSIIAPDGVATTFDPKTSIFNPFKGSSAAAPHIAGVAALMLQRSPDLSWNRIREILKETATPIDNNTGFVRADRAVIESFSHKFEGTKGKDILQGTEKADNIYGHKGNDLLLGNSGKDYLVGGKGKDILIGGEGDDVLVGDGGKNTLVGGKGKDTFLLDNKSFSIIADFDVQQDSLAFLTTRGAADLTVSQYDGDTFISSSNDVIAKVLRVQLSQNINITLV